MKSGKSAKNIVPVNPSRPEKDIIQKAATIIKHGGLVVFPTETVYGIAALFGNKKAYERLYEVKKRDKNKPFTIHISSAEMVKESGCSISESAGKLIKHYWPGPLTLILPLDDKEGKLGFRLPDHPVALALITAVGGAVVAPSANISTHQSPVTAEDAYDQVGQQVDLVLDGGKTGYGRDSTIVDLSDGEIRIIRQGAILAEDILKILHDEVESE